MSALRITAAQARKLGIAIAARGRTIREPSDGEERLAADMRLVGLPAPEREFRFDPQRRWRFDFAWPALRLAVEVEGGTWSQGAHTRGRGFEEDCEKHNAAVAAGWRCLRVTTAMVKDGRALDLIEEEVSRG